MTTEDMKPDERNPSLQATFVHPSEAALARIFDFYQITWQYEPRTFPLQWDEHGHVTEAFSPDFYLPEQDLYIELTTLRQKLITPKHRKLRRLRELYPDVKIKLLNRADFQRMMDRYGIDNHHELVGQPHQPEG